MVSHCGQPEFHQFDFWYGNWDNFTPEKKKTADVVISRILGGCGLTESFMPLQGGQAFAVATYSAANHHWEYFWAGTNGYTLFLQAVPRGKGMRFTAAEPEPSQPKLTEMWDLMPQSDGTIKEVASASTDGGNTWKVEETVIWIRKK
jgi:hypothetical protein